MDPKSRRLMWNIISRVALKRKTSSFLLTTHSMEEAEALSTRIAIMVGGKIKCIGTIQHIKNKFGGGYEVEVKLEPPTMEEIEQRISEYNEWKHTPMHTIEELKIKLITMNLAGYYIIF